MLAKRRGSKNLRLSILPNGRVRVGLPAWAPYAAGIKFAQNRAGWISQHLEQHQPAILRDGSLIGKSYRLQFVAIPSATKTSARLSGNNITITSHLHSSHQAVQTKAAQACERALKKEAEKLLIYRLKELAGRHGFGYRQSKVMRLASRWGSCSNQKDITLNYYLVQLPWHLIDYVILHELVHTQHLDHSPAFWARFAEILPDVKTLKKEIRQYRPVLLPS